MVNKNFDNPKELWEVLRKLEINNEGSNSLSFVVYDNEDKIKLNMPSRKQKVNISQELLNTLSVHHIKYKLN